MKLLILESEAHSVWVNSRILEKHHITDETPDIRSMTASAIWDWVKYISPVRGSKSDGK